MGDVKRIPVNSVGIKIKEAREKADLTKEELVDKINKDKIDLKKITKWERGSEFPDLDEMYILATYLDLNPNELLKLRNQIQDESQVEPAWFWRHLFGKITDGIKPGFKLIIEIILGICVLYLLHNFVDLTDKMGGKQAEEFTEQLIEDDIEEFVYHNADGLEASKIRKNKYNQVINESIDNIVNDNQ